MLLRVIEGSNFSKHGRSSSGGPAVVIGLKGTEVIHDGSYRSHCGGIRRENQGQFRAKHVQAVRARLDINRRQQRPG